MHTQEPLEELLSREQATKILGLKPGTLAVWKCTKRYDLPVVMVGRLPKYRPSDLLSFIERNTIKQT